MKLTKKEIIDYINADPKLEVMLRAETLERFADMAVKGASLDHKYALRLMVAGYMETCGISIGERTVIYDAAQNVLEVFLLTDDPLAESLRARDVDLICECMHEFNEEYDKEIYDEYDVTCMDNKDYLKITGAIISAYDEEMAMSICYGVARLLMRWN